jgi:hypothetical protein
VLVLRNEPLPGEAEALTRLDVAGVPYVVATNTSHWRARPRARGASCGVRPFTNSRQGRFRHGITWQGGHRDGASQGIGRGIALALAKEGATTAVLARRCEKLVEFVKEIEEAGWRALAVECNVRFRDQVERAVAATVYEFGGIDIMVHAARGDLQTLPLDEERDDQFILEWETGPFAEMRLMQASFPCVLVRLPPVRYQVQGPADSACCAAAACRSASVIACR